MSNLSLFENKGQILVSSRVVAKDFEKQHNNVLRDVRNISEGMLKLEHTPNEYFIESQYTNPQNHQEYSEFLLTRKGFLMYVFSFQGNEAFKMKYIEEFDRMESLLRERQTTDWLKTREQGKLIRRQETDAIQKLIPYAEGQGSKSASQYMYTNYTNLVNKIVGLQTGKRGEASVKELMLVALLEDIIMKTIEEEIAKGVYYKEIYKACKAKAYQFANLAYLDVS